MITFANKSIETLVKSGVEFRCYNSRLAEDYTTLGRVEKMVEWALTMDRMTGRQSTADFRVGSDWFRLHFVNVGGDRLHVVELSRVYGM